MHKNKGPVYYGDYLQLPKLLDSQMPLSRKHADENNKECHDEMLFIIVHQVYELWFKQIIHELDSMLSVFNKNYVPESDLATVIQRLERIKKIQTLFIAQFEVLETMTPMDFLEFRDLLIPASGFQSVQFREIEIKMGLHTNDRLDVDREFFTGRLNEADKQHLANLDNSPTLLRLVEKWLERLPFTEMSGFSFWKEYQNIINKMLTDDEALVTKHATHLTPKQKEIQIANIESSKATFNSLFDESKHSELVKLKQRKLSQKAILNALFILSYRNEPMLTLPFQVLTSMMDIDENFTTWRYRHALMAHRMLGNKIGTGGSSGHEYLKRAADNNRVFLDLFNLSTFLIPNSILPIIPNEIKQKLNFHV